MVADASVRPRPSALGYLLPPLGQPARFSSSQFPDSRSLQIIVTERTLIGSRISWDYTT